MSEQVSYSLVFERDPRFGHWYYRHPDVGLNEETEEHLWSSLRTCLFNGGGLVKSVFSVDMSALSNERQNEIGELRLSYYNHLKTLRQHFEPLPTIWDVKENWAWFFILIIKSCDVQRTLHDTVLVSPELGDSVLNERMSDVEQYVQQRMTQVVQ